MPTIAPCPVHRDVAFRYHLKNRFNPNHASERVAVIKVRRKFFLIAIISCLILSACAAMTVWFITKDDYQLGEKVRYGSIILLPLLISCATVRLVIQIHRERSEEKKLTAEIGLFEERYQAFLETVGLTPVNLYPLSDKKIERLCEEILGTQAKATAVKSPRAKKVREKRLVDVYEAVTNIGYGKKALEDYLKKAKRKPRTKKSTSRDASA